MPNHSAAFPDYTHHLRLKVLNVNVGINEEILENGQKDRPAEILQNIKIRRSKMNLSDRRANTELIQNLASMIINTMKALCIRTEPQICPRKHV